MLEDDRIKVGYVVSYKDTQYVRSHFIIRCIENANSLQLFTANNTTKSIFRYIQTVLRLIKMRILYNPDVYILGFRGAEIFWFVRLITIGKPLVYDEFVSTYMWFIDEHAKVKKNSIAAKMIKLYVKSTLKVSQLLLSDTELHARYGVENFGIKPNKYRTLYVGTNEELFNTNAIVPASKSNEFKVLFYGTFLPLHGLDVILEAASLLKNEKRIKFIIIGSDKHGDRMDEFLKSLKKLELENVEHLPWVQFEKLPTYIEKADICLGGPFGNTTQARKVITGKTFQFLALGRATVIGRIDENVGFIDRENCILIDQGSPESLASAINWAYLQKDKLKLIGDAGRALYVSRFSVRAQTPLLEETIKKLI